MADNRARARANANAKANAKAQAQASSIVPRPSLDFEVVRGKDRAALLDALGADPTTASCEVLHQSLDAVVLGGWADDVDGDDVDDITLFFHHALVRQLDPLRKEAPWTRTLPLRLAPAASRPPSSVKVEGEGEGKNMRDDIRVGECVHRVYMPDGSPEVKTEEEEGWPVMLFFHGDVPCVVMVVGYRLAPVHPFPAAVGDGMAALEWVKREGTHRLPIDPSRILLAGMSAGGNLAAVVAMLAAQQPEPITALLQVLMMPVCDNTATLESETWRERPRAPELDGDKLTNYQAWYLGDRTSPHWAGADWRASPLLAPRDVLCKSPKTHVVIASEDILQAENHRFVDCLQRAGVDATKKVYPDAAHTFMRVDKMVAQGRCAIVDVVKLVQKSLVA